MGLFQKLFGSRQASTQPAYSRGDIKIIGDMASRLVDVINESLQLSNTSKNPDTKISRLNVAKLKLEELKVMVAQYSFLEFTTLPQVEASIAGLEAEFLSSGYKEIADGNTNGKALEDEGRIDEAIMIYESLVDRSTDTPFTYKRLAIIYKKKRSQDDEKRILKTAISAIDPDSTHLSWFQDRLTKMKK